MDIEELKILVRRYIDLRDAADSAPFDSFFLTEFDRVEEELLRALDD